MLSLAVEHNAVLITEDKDFGELVFRFQLNHAAIILIRLPAMTSHLKATTVAGYIQMYFTELKNAFTVIEENKLRIKK